MLNGGYTCLEIKENARPSPLRWLLSQIHTCESALLWENNTILTPLGLSLLTVNKALEINIAGEIAFSMAFSASG